MATKKVKDPVLKDFFEQTNEKVINTRSASITINKEFYKLAQKHFRAKQLTFSSGAKLAISEYLKKDGIEL